MMSGLLRPAGATGNGEKTEDRGPAPLHAPRGRWRLGTGVAALALLLLVPGGSTALADAFTAAGRGVNEVPLRGPVGERPGLVSTATTAAPRGVRWNRTVVGPTSAPTESSAPEPVSALLAQRAIEPPDGPRAGETPDARIPGPRGRKSPALAGLLSAILPGLGQAYLGQQSAYAFLGIEAAAWIAHASLRDTGKDKEREYKRYADAHWTFERYRDPNSGPCTSDGHSDQGVQDSTLVFLYETRRDDWYEDIGKLTIYSCGWDSPDNRLFYRDMRDDSNDFLRASRYATSIVLLNHIVSALAAAKGAASHNQHLTGNLDLQIDLEASLLRPGATVALRRTF